MFQGHIPPTPNAKNKLNQGFSYSRYQNRNHHQQLLRTAWFNHTFMLCGRYLLFSVVVMEVGLCPCAYAFLLLLKHNDRLLN
jgi:hypothetical protein